MDFELILKVQADFLFHFFFLFGKSSLYSVTSRVLKIARQYYIFLESWVRVLYDAAIFEKHSTTFLHPNCYRKSCLDPEFQVSREHGTTDTTRWPRAVRNLMFSIQDGRYSPAFHIRALLARILYGRILRFLPWCSMKILPDLRSNGQSSLARSQLQFLRYLSKQNKNQATSRHDDPHARETFRPRNAQICLAFHG